MSDVPVITIAALAGALTALLLGAAIPSLLLWHKTRECRHLLNELLQLAARKPVRPSNTAKALGGGDIPTSSTGDKVPVVRTTPPTAIDDIMRTALERDTEENQKPR